MDSLSSLRSQTTRFCLISLFLFYHLPCALSQPDYTFCETLYHCGNITAGFPFSGENRQEDCGHPSLKLNCNKSSNATSLFISGHNYTVLHIDKNILRLSRQDFSGSFCSASFSSTPFPPDLFQNLPFYKNITVFYVCDSRHHFLGNFTCLVKGLGSVVQNSMYHKHCDKSFDVTVPTSFVQKEEALDLSHFESVLRKGFEVELEIYERFGERSGEQCLFAGTENARLYQISKQFCCKNVSGSGMNCHIITDKSVTKAEELFMLIIFGTVAGLVLVVYVVAFSFLLRDRIRENALRDQNLDALVTLRRYSYGQIKKITKSFTEVVGQGGFGTVYKGKLCDGSKVAVKVLKDSKGNCEDFINEVASMSQTSHVNIVSLLGFCYEGSKRAIVYEFLENGSLDQFISKSGDRSVSTLYEIALGVARGIEYLHYGCKTRIVHFDIKPQNVLLDDNLRPKVSDFGLAKLCDNQESILSLLDMRGTIGYIAPEVFSRMYGSVSHKSDVYSYGMLVLEMIGARNKERGENENSNNSSAYFPGWIYKDLENGDNARLLGSDELTREEEEIAKKIILVSLWCIQQCPSDRPSMNKVVEMMEGSLDSLQAPPKPLLHMPMQNVSELSQPSEEISILSEVYSMNVGDL